MESSDILRCPTLPIANLLQDTTVVVEGGSSAAHTEGECHGGFHESGAVKFTEIDDKSLLVVRFQGMGHIGDVHLLDGPADTQHGLSGGGILGGILFG